MAQARLLTQLADFFRLSERMSTRTLIVTLVAALVAANASGAADDPSPDLERGTLKKLLIELAENKLKMANQLELGDGVPKAPDLARELYCDAARSGLAEAQYRLGWIYANGRGVPRSESTAQSLFRLAAEQGHPQAMALESVVKAPTDEPAVLPACMSAEEVVAQTKPEPAPGQNTLHGVQHLEIRTNAWVAGLLERKSSAPVVELVKQLAPRYAIDPRLVLAIIQAESAFNPEARSPKNAVGLMQLMPDTANRFGVSKPQDPAQNIRGGISYLKWLIREFQGNVPLVVAAYNAGEGAVKRYGGIPPYTETITYVRRVRTLYPFPEHPEFWNHRNHSASEPRRPNATPLLKHR